MSISPAPIESLSSQIYRALLVFFPPRFRAEYEREMVIFFRDSLRAARRRGGTLDVLLCWLDAVLDVGTGAVREWLAHTPGLAHSFEKLGLGLAAGAAAGGVAGLAARLAMRGVAIAGGLHPAFTWQGTLLLVVLGVIVGAIVGVGFMPLRPVLPGSGAWKGLNYGLVLFLVGLAPPLMFYREGEALLASPWVGAGLFAPVCLAYGATLAIAVQRLERRFSRTSVTPLPQAQPAIQWPEVARQVLALGVFALLLELAVLGALSISRYHRPLPLDIIRAARDLDLPLSVLRNGNRWLVLLTTLGYFGLASVFFWGRRRSSMARFTALALLLFGSGLFNTGAGYYADMVKDLTVVQAALHGLQVLGVTALLALLYLFPHGRLAAAWARPLVFAWLTFAAAWLVRPLPDRLTFVVSAAFFVSGLVAQLQRFRAAAPEERPQLRWPVAGFAIAVSSFSLVAVVVLARPELRLASVEGLRATATFGLYMLPWLFIPATIAYAMRRHRLWAA